MTIIFISHKLHEVRALADSLTMLRAGQVVGSSPLSEIADLQITRMLMGRDVEVPRRQRHAAEGSVVVEVANVTTRAPDPNDRITDLSLTIRADEIVGIAGVDGSGQRGLVSVLSGLARPASGTVHFCGREMGKASTARWRAEGLAHLPADRFSQGGSPALTLIDNAIAGTDGDRDLQWGPFFRHSKVRQRVKGMAKEFSVRMRGIGERLDSLSGGNAQKLIAARELSGNPRLLIADQPTRGIDVSSAAFLHVRINDVARNGAAVLLVTADLEELLRLADRIVVLFNGRIAVDMANDPSVTPALLGPYMLGLEQAE